MREQIVQQPPTRKRPVKRDDTVYYPAEENPYITDEDDLSTNDDFIEEDDAFYNTRQPSSVVRRGTIPPTTAQTRLRITRHQTPPPIQRASLKAQQPQQKPVPPKTQKRLHWLFYVGCGAMTSLALWTIGSTAFSWLQTQHDNSVYGYPRTYQIDANVGHAGISHFIAENLHGDIIVIEVHPSNLAKTHIYQGPTFTGAGTDLQPATLSFQDVNSDGKPDMVIAVGSGRYILINTGNAFRPTTSADKVSQEVN